MKRSLLSILSAAIISCDTPAYMPPPEDPSYAFTSEPQLQLEEIADDKEKTAETPIFTEELNQIKKLSYFETLSPEYKALLDTISWAEYTLEPCIEGISPYQVLVAGEVVEDKHNRYGGKFEKCPGNYFIGFGDHPRIKVKWHRKARASTAAGKLQWMERTYDGLRRLQNCGPNKDEDCGLFKDITPDSQDQAGVYVIQVQLGITQEMLEASIQGGDFKHIWKKLARTWASLPYYNWRGKGIGKYRRQRNTRSFEKLHEKYMEKYEFYKSRP